MLFGCYGAEADADLGGKLSLTWHRRQSQEQLADVALQTTFNAGLSCCRVEADADLDGELSLTWHRRQSKEERLADAAEARLLGLASRPRTAANTAQQHVESHQQQPVSHCRDRSQVTTQPHVGPSSTLSMIVDPR